MNFHGKAVDREDAIAAESRQTVLARRQHIEQLQQHMQACPDDGKALYALSQVYHDLGEVHEFVNWARSFCRSERHAWRISCRVLVEGLGRTADAVSMLMEMHAEEPDNAWVCCYLAKLQPKEAEHWYEKALAADPNCAAANLGVADLHRRAERFVEAARLYQAAHMQNRLAPRPLFRLGEALVQDGKTEQGRQYLLQVLHGVDCAYHLHAAVTVALSYVLDQEHRDALQYCQHVEQLHVGPGSTTRVHLQLTQLLKGITLLRIGDIEAAIETMRDAANASGCPTPVGNSILVDAADATGAQSQASFDGCFELKRHAWDQTIQLTLSHAEILRGDLAAAERHMEIARQIAGPAQDPDVLVGMAYLHQARGDLEEAERLLRTCLRIDNSSCLALLRMGYVLLCRDQVDRSIQFLQKCCTRHSTQKLNFGKAQMGAAHIYLCVAHHRRRFDGSASQQHSTLVDPVADDHFRKGYDLQVDLQAGLARICTAAASRPEAALDIAARLIGGKPSRLVTLDLTPKQAAILLIYSEHGGVGPSINSTTACAGQTATPSAPSRPPPTVRQAAGYTIGQTATVAATTAMCGTPSALLGTVSTAASTSAGPSRNSSDPNLRRGPGGPLCGSTTSCSTDAAAFDPRCQLPPDKCLDFGDIDFGECISRGELTLVHKATMRSSGLEVVVKMLHNTDRVIDDNAAEELRAEINIISKLSHPRLVFFVGACLELNRVALVTRLAPGGNLHHALHQLRRQFSRRERFQIAEEFLEGVQYLHSRSPPIAHLDLKSLNLLLDAEGRHVQICDFGLARELYAVSSGGCAGICTNGCEGGSCGSDTRPTARGGSPRYMAPECYDASFGPLTEKADVWASGCILIEIFGDCLPYAECSNVQQILKNMLVHRCGPIVPETIEAPVRAVVSSTLAFEAPQRLAIGQVLSQMQRAATSNTSRLQWIQLPET